MLSVSCVKLKTSRSSWEMLGTFCVGGGGGGGVGCHCCK